MNTLESKKQQKGIYNIYRNGKILIKNLDLEQVKMMAKALKNFTNDYVMIEGNNEKISLSNF